MKTNFDPILTACLDDVLHGRRTIATCLESYPDCAAELETALIAALLAARLNKPEMAAEAVNALETRLRTTMNQPRHP